MNEVGGTESGTGLRAIKSSRTSDANFESSEFLEDDWDVGIGNLIIDLDADIEKTNEANKNNNNSTGTSSSAGGSGSSNNLQQMHIPLTSSSGSNSNNKSGKSGGSVSGSQGKGSSNTSSSSSDINTVMEHSAIVDKGLKMKIKRTKTGTKSGVDAKHEIVKNDVVGSANGTTGGNTSSNSNYASNKSISDSISSKNSHSSHKDKDKLLIKDGLLHDNSHDNSGSINNATSGKDGEHGGGGGKVKTPRKGSTKEKKTKNSGNVGNSGNNKKEESNSKALSNSSSSGGGSGNSNTSSSGTHAKDNKEFFSTTVNLNVPNVIPNSSSSAFVKTTATIKVPTAPSSNSSSNSALHNVHSSGGGGDSSSSTSRSQGLTGNNSSASNNSSTPWGSVSPSKGADKGRLSPSVANLSNASEKSTGNSYNKKGRAFATSDKTGSTQDENSAGSNTGSSSNSSYRNQGALVNPATDLSSSSSTFVQGVSGTQPGNGGSFGSSKESGKGGRNPTPTTQDVCVGTSVGTVTEPDCLGPCEPGTTVTLEGIVWHETESGVLVVNVTWRGKTYVGTLIDCTKNDWAPPRFCDSPASDLEMRTPKNRGKRGRAQTATPVNEPPVADTRSANAKLRNGAKGRRGSNTAAAFVAPASPVKPDQWPKRKTRGSENESQEEVNPKNAKRLKVSKDSDRKERRSNSPAADNEKSRPSSPQYIECPEPNCSKRYTHMNGLRYHLSHAHSNNFVAQEDSDSNLSTASTTNASTQQESTANSNNDVVEPMMVDGPDVSENSNSSTSKNAVSNLISDAEPISAPPTPGKKSGNATTPTTTPSKVDDKIYDLSSDADLNPSKDSSQDVPEPYSKSPKGSSSANKVQPPQSKADSGSDSDSKLVPENLSKDSSSTSSSSSSSSASTTPTTTTPTLTPRTPILTVPVVPSYMSLQNRNMVHGHVVNVPRVEPRESSDNSCSPAKNSSGQGSAPSSKNAPWQPHAQAPHVMNTSPPSQSINVPLNIPMNISEKLGGGASAKDKDKNGNSPDQASSKKNKHKKKSKDRDKERDGKSKEKDRQDMSSKGLNIPMAGGPSDYSRSSGIFHNSSMGTDRSKDISSGDDNDSSRKNSLENREDPQSPAYSDISDANDSGPDAELNVGGALKDPNLGKGLVIPGELKKDPIVPGVPGAPPYQFFNHNLHSPYLDSLSYAASRQQNKDGAPPIPGNVPEDSEKNRPGGPIKHPIVPPNSQVPSTSTVVSGPGDDPRRSPKMDFSKYPYPNYFSYPYSGYHPYENNPFGNSLPPSAENSFNASPQGRMFPGMEDREKEGGPGNSEKGKGDKPGDKDEPIPPVVQIKQEPIEREEPRSRKESRSQSHSMNASDDKNHEVKREFGSDHGEPKLVPPYMSNSSSSSGSSGKHKEHSSKRDREDRHDSRRHDGKDLDGKSEKSSRSSSSNIDKSKNSEESEPKERKDEGAKPTMETTGPPPPPTASAYYLAQSYLPSNPFGLPFDPSHPLYRNMIVPGPYPGSPYGIHPGSIPRFSSPGGPTPLPEDLSRPGPGGPPGNPSKALDLLQHHAAQYYSSHKIHELQERALKSPSPQVAAAQRAERDGPSSGPGGPPTASSPGGHPLNVPGVPHSIGGGRGGVGGTSASGSMPKPADLSKDTKPTIGPGGSLLAGGPNSDNVRTPPPTQHHVHSHTHHHTHVGIGYPILPTVPPQYSPHYGVLATPPATPSVIPPFPAQKPN